MRDTQGSQFLSDTSNRESLVDHLESADPDAGDPEVQYQCSHCHKTADSMSRYCPNCGAKMDRTE